MNKLKLYRVNIDYIKYLYNFDNRVQYNPYKDEEYTKRRPYLGVVLQIHNLNYFVPLEHPRKDHILLKNSSFTFKIRNGKYGMLGFNNMLPIPDSQLIEFNINEQPKKYRYVLINQYRFCNNHIDEILTKANYTYVKRKNSKNKFILKVCCNFELLEKKCNEFIRNNESNNN